MNISLLDSNDSGLLDQVIELGDANSKTLGFLPRDAFRESAKNDNILVAVRNGKLLGYLLFYLRQRNDLVRITHLCVNPVNRGQGIARKLVMDLQERTKQYKGILVKCRNDYEANHIWPQLGFQNLGEVPGRAVTRSTRLDIWWLDNGRPSLFSYMDQLQFANKTRVAIDNNVFNDLMTEDISHPESLALKADWMCEENELCVTTEILNEINRITDPTERAQHRRFAQTFPKACSEQKAFSKILGELKTMFPEMTTVSQTSDLAHIAWAIADENVSFFLTRDQGLRKQGKDIYDRFQLWVLDPAEFIVERDRLFREMEYSPSRLSGSCLDVHRISQNDIYETCDVFRISQLERKYEFETLLKSCLAMLPNADVMLVYDADEPIALYAINMGDQNELIVPLLRVCEHQHSLKSVISRHLASFLVHTAETKDKRVICITDPYAGQSLGERALTENGFSAEGSEWVHFTLAISGTRAQVVAELDKVIDQQKHGSKTCQGIMHWLKNADNEHDFSQLERILWPCKITDSGIPSYLVPVKPKWAMQLFDYALAKQGLWGSSPDLMLRVENAYYSAAIRRSFSPPARILWYVTDAHNHGAYNVQAIRACSYLDEKIIGNPKDLFHKFERLGVFEWSDVFKIAKNDVEREILAFQFSLTEVFSRPVSLSQLRKLWFSERETNFSTQCIISVPDGFFYKVYEIGKGYTDGQ